MPRANEQIASIIEQHCAETAAVWRVRDRLVGGMHSRLEDIAAFDERLDAHVDAVRLIGEPAIAVIMSMLDAPEGPETFAATALALALEDTALLGQVSAVAEAMPHTRRAMVAGYGWSSPVQLQGVVRAMLRSGSPFERAIGIAACAAHRVQPGPALVAGMRDEDSYLRARSFRAAGELGARECLGACELAVEDPDRRVLESAGWSAVALGSRQVLDRLAAEDALTLGASRKLFAMCLQAMTVEAGRGLLRRLSERSGICRPLVAGVGLVGDCQYVPWLIKQMRDAKLARLAGEAFGTITGLGLVALGLDRKPPENLESIPNDDPGDQSVDMDPDDGLPWPDPAKCAAWWDANKHRFQEGLRYFMGAPPTREHCVKVLRDGYQRQRIAAAQYLCLLNPGTPLFNTSAPAWRQQRWLAKKMA